MSSLPPFHPVRRLLDFDRCIDEAFSRLIHEPWGCAFPQSLWQPAIDLLETDDAYLIEADLPGVAPEDVRVQVEERRVTLSGRRQSLACQQSERSLRIERLSGEFSRTLTFDQPVEVAAVQLQFEHGILRIRIPKQGGSSAGSQRSE